jgi:hypothetical protein
LHRVLLATVALLVMTPAGSSYGQYLRCGGELVVVGDLTFDVLNKCGEPALKETRLVEREHRAFDANRGEFRSFSTTIEVHYWTYNFGRHRFLYVVRLVGGKVVGIKSGGYGY